MKAVGDAFKMSIYSYIQDQILEMAMAAKAQKSAISPCKAQPKFGIRFDNPEISVKIYLDWIYYDLLNFTQNQIPELINNGTKF